MTLEQRPEWASHVSKEESQVERDRKVTTSRTDMVCLVMSRIWERKEGVGEGAGGLAKPRSHGALSEPLLRSPLLAFDCSLWGSQQRGMCMQPGW